MVLRKSGRVGRCRIYPKPMFQGAWAFLFTAVNFHEKLASFTVHSLAFFSFASVLHNDMRILYLLTVSIVLIVAYSAPVFSQPNFDGRADQDIQPPKPTEIKIVKPGVNTWKLDGFGAFMDSIPMDTTLNYFHIYNPVFKEAITATYVGNYATPYLDNNFFNRRSNIDFYFLRTREAYLLTPQDVKYYNTRTPYTLLDFTQSEHRTRKNETRFNVLHSQNVSPFWNFTFRFDQARSAGQYKNQATKNNFVTLYSSYNRNRLNIYGGFISNSILNNENGGLHESANLLEEPDTEFLDVNLTSVRSEFGNFYFYTTGEYQFGKFIQLTEEETDTLLEEEVLRPRTFKPFAGIIYSFEFQNHTKQYFDQEDSTNTFFENAYYGYDYESDSLRFGKIRNVLQLKQYENPDRKISFGKRAFIGQEFVRLSIPGPIMNIYNRQVRRYSNIYAGGGIFRQTGSFWRWNFEGRIYLLGRSAGQTELSGIITKPLFLFGDSLASFNINGRIENLMPDFFQEEFYSNRIRWNKDLKMEQRMTAGGNFRIPGRGTELSANYALINNYIYNDGEGIPAQFGGQLLVLSAYADKDFNLGKFHFRTRLLWQKAGNEEVLHLPDFSAFISANYRFIISKVLFTHLGVDTRYNSEYYADAYDPVTGFFHLQNEQKLGGYPYIDVYANLQLKRTRVFFKMMNVGTGFIDKEYYTTPGYPMNRKTFRMGVAWSFYD